MVARALGRDKEQNVSARVSLAAAHHAGSKRLCRPSPVVPHISDPVCGDFRWTARSEDRVGSLWRTGSALMLLAFAEISNSLSARVVDRGVGLRAAVSVSDEHGQSAAVRDHLPRRRNPPVFQTKILATAAPRAYFYLDVRPVCRACDGDDFLGHHDCDNGAQV